MEHAMLLGSIASRLVPVQAVDTAITNFASDVDAMLAGLLPVVPAHQAQRLSDTALHINADGSHEVFAMHAGLEFALHAAVLQGWGAADVAGIRRGDALLVFGPQVVQQGLTMLAVRTGAAESGCAASVVTLGSPDAGDQKVVEVPASSLITTSTGTPAASLEVVLRNTGIALELPEAFASNRTSSLQLCVFDPEQFPREAELVQLRGADAENFLDARRVPLLTPADVLVGEDAKRQVRRLSRRLNVFDPFHAA